MRHFFLWRFQLAITYPTQPQTVIAMGKRKQGSAEAEAEAEGAKRAANAASRRSQVRYTCYEPI